MATTVVNEPEAGISQRIIARADVRVRLLVLLVVAAAIITLAPLPWAPLGASSLAALAFETGRRR